MSEMMRYMLEREAYQIYKGIFQISMDTLMYIHVYDDTYSVIKTYTHGVYYDVVFYMIRMI